MAYFVWIPIVILLNVICGILSLHVKSDGWGWRFWSLYLVNVIAVWPFVAKYSKNVLFDGVLYDVLMLVAYSVAVILWRDKVFNIFQVLAIVLVLIGVIILRVYT